MGIARILPPMQHDVHVKALRRAAEILGGQDKLREHLNVAMRELSAWLAGAAKPPLDVFLKAVDIISGTPEPRRPSSAAIQRARQLRGETDALRAALLRTRQRVLQVQAEILASRKPVYAGPPVSMAEFLKARFSPGEGRVMVEAALDAGIEAGQASRGNLQLACAEGLRIVAQRGFEQPFLEFFALVHSAESASGAALEQRRQVLVADVQSDPIFVGTAAADILAGAGVRAVQSTPVIGQTGELLGMLSTHYEEPRIPGEQPLRAIESVARRTAFWLEGGGV
jgi:hypothetical protein